MKILYLSHRLPYPPQGGAKIRPFHMIKHLSAKHHVTVASLARNAHEEQAIRGLADYCAGQLIFRVKEPLQYARMGLLLPTPMPSSMGYFYTPQLKSAIQDELKRQSYDLIFVHCSSVAQYVQHVTDIPKVLDFVDMDSQKWLIYSKFKMFPLSAGYWLEGTKLQHAEKTLAAKFDMCTCTTLAELETLHQYASAARTDWFPNGVDFDYFAPSDETYDPELLSFVGRMDYYPNEECMIDFCRNTLPLIRQHRPAVKLCIIGADPTPKVKALGSIPGVTVTGFVADVRPYVQASALMIAPLNIARGTQNKILEGMAMRIPVVSSTLAARGVDVKPGEHLLTADTPQEYADAILKLLDDPAQRERYAQSGRQRVIERHDWAASMTRLDNIIAKCIEQFNCP